MSIQVSASVQVSPSRIRLSWPSKTGTTGIAIYRKSFGAGSWGSPVASLPGTATSWDDDSVAIGTAYEYQVLGSGSTASAGYVASGIEVPLVESRGKIVLIVDNTMASPLQAELALLQRDLAGDGWVVLRHDVSRSDTVVNVRAVIRADYLADPGNVRAVLLFGHVPVPYSGAINPDDHPEHFGAWPADLYYGEMDGGWTDSVTFDASVAGRQRNVAGDGKFDQNAAPSSIELEVGRVDLANLPAFAPKTEIDLLRQYLGKDHAYRHALIRAQQRGLVDDGFFDYGDDWGASAAGGWRDFSSFFGASSVQGLDWFSTLATQSYVWGFACGPGSWDQILNVGTTAQFASTDTKVVFTMLFGSWFGDWDSTDNFLRAPLATTTWGLTSAWSGRPLWHFHHMGMGATVGYSARLSQNNAGLYAGPSFSLAIWAALMGDPTLRMHVVAPPSGLSATPSGSTVGLSWSASSDAVLGYNVYRAPTPAGPFTRINGGSLVTGTAFNDTSAPAGTSTWAVRAVLLQGSSSGTYFNASQAVFVTASVSPRSSTTTTVTSSVNPSVPGQSVTFTATVTSGAGAPTGTVTFSNGVKTFGTGSVDGTGHAVFSTSSLPSGISNIVASYGGDSNFLPSASGSLAQMVKFSTSVALGSSVNPASSGQVFSLTGTVAPAGGGAPSGTVTFFDGAVNIGSASVNGSGQASLSLTALGSGTHAMTAVYSGDSQFQGSTAPVFGESVRTNRTDFDGIGTSDLIWRNSSSGLAGIWLMNGTSVSSVAALPTVSNPQWEIQGAGDFNGDGHVDIVWRNTSSGLSGVWLMNGSSVSSVVSLPTVSDTRWRIVAVADMDGDGSPDLVWRNTVTGDNEFWRMNGTAPLSVVPLPAVSDMDWEIVGAADFDGDGMNDLVWRNRLNGLNAIWTMNGASISSIVSLPTVADGNWSIVSVGDFNQDGKPDLAWDDRVDGLGGIWLMNGTGISSVVSLPSVSDPAWILSGPR